MDLKLIGLIVYGIVNLCVFLLYGIDKRRAVRHEWRISEKTLLLSAAAGVFGAMAGIWGIRHKTQKPKFYLGVPGIFVLEVILFYIVFMK